MRQVYERPRGDPKLGSFRDPAPTTKGLPLFLHTVHFWLKPDLTADQRTRFIAGCQAIAKSQHVAALRVGVPAGTDREVVDRTWDVQLVVEFEDRGMHDAYQSPDDPEHTKFVETFKTFWTKVLIYDSVPA